MILSDRDILIKLKEKEIIIKPFKKENLQPASYDLTLGNEFLIFNKNKLQIIDPKISVRDKMEKVIKKDSKKCFILHPGDFVLGVIKEQTGVGNKFVGRLEGKSSLARLGLFVHATAGFLDPGNSLNMTLELFNGSGLPIKLYPGMKVAQMAFEELSSECLTAYGHKKLSSKYFGAKEVQASKMNENFRKEKHGKTI